MSPRARLDQVLVDRNLVESRSQARRLILAGRVRVGGAPADKPGTPVAADAAVELETPPRYVSRGGDKLEPVLDACGETIAGASCVDIGASTGGFTDCLLQHGAALVVAIDVGYGQLDWRLRQDPRVVVMERCNARHLTAASVAAVVAPLTVAVVDASFISVAKLLPAIGRICAPRSAALVLVKPQFEAGPEQVTKGGVVKSAVVRRATVIAVADAALDLGWTVRGAYPSPLRGPAGNWECFLHLGRGRAAENPGLASIETLHVPDDTGAGCA